MPKLVGGKWGDVPRGTDGGVVTWSLVDGNTSGLARVFGARSDRTVDAQQATKFNVIEELKDAFEAWSDVANIEFIQVKDDGARIGAGFSADIRIAFGAIDGGVNANSNFGRTLARAFATELIDNPETGDIVFDKDDFNRSSDKSLFGQVAVHEIGHSIGLGHVSRTDALMNPVIQGFSKPQKDDIEGAVRLYGEDRQGQLTLSLSRDQTEIEIIENRDGLRIAGDERANIVRGAGGDEGIRGFGGGDKLMGRGGQDRLVGGTGEDTLRGGGEADILVGGGDADVLRGGGFGDRLKGGRGEDRLMGGGGDDVLLGGGGNDLLVGGKGDDTLNGGNGEDRYVLDTQPDDDLGLGFIIGKDRVDVTRVGSGLDFDDVTLSASADGVRISVGDSATLTLEGVRLEELSADSFFFGTEPLVAPEPTPLPDPAPEPQPEPEPDATADQNPNRELTTLLGEQLPTVFPHLSEELQQFARPFAFRPPQPNETVETGTSNEDTFAGITNTDVFFGGDGDDTILPQQNVRVDAGEGNDDILLWSQALGSAALYGGGGEDQLFGTAGLNFIDGGAGADVIMGHGGNDLLFGGGGDDTIGGGDGDDVLVSDAVSSARLEGNGGNDTLIGGRDLLGGDGDDLMVVVGPADAFPGSGEDRIVFAFTDPTKATAAGVIDFAPGEDKLDFSAMRALGDVGIEEQDGNTIVTIGEHRIFLFNPSGEVTEADFIL